MRTFLLLFLAAGIAEAAPAKPVPPAPVADSLLRVACDEDAVGAEVTMNGKFKGECPLDISVTEGTYKLRVLKRVDALHEREFEQDVRMGSGVVKKVEAVLSPVHLNAEGRRQDEIRRAEIARAEQERREAAARAEAERRRVAEEKIQREKEAFASTLMKAESGDVAAMKEVAAQYKAGRGTNPDDLAAARWIERAADRGDPEAMFKMGTGYENAIDVSKDYAKAFSWYQRCASAGHANCIGALAAMYMNGWGVPRDVNKAAEWARKGEALGSGRAMLALANMHQAGVGGLDKSVPKYWAYVLKGAELGEPRAMYYQARAELKTDPLPQDQLDKSRAWLEKAIEYGAEGGYAEAKSLFMLGKFYFSGQGVRKDDKVAVRMIERAAKLEDVEAMSMMAVWYMVDYKGESPLKRDDNMAVGWIQKAAAAGDADGMQNLGYFYYNGKGGLPVNQALGREWSKKAADLRLVRAFEALK